MRDRYLDVLATLERNKSVGASASAQKSRRVKRDKPKATITTTTTAKREEPALAAKAAGAATRSRTEKKQVSNFVGFLRRYVLALASHLNGSTYAYFRAIVFTVGLLFAICRAEYRQKVLRVLALCWGKLSGTVKMGMRVNSL